jgi:hypothetical protein
MDVGSSLDMRRDESTSEMISPAGFGLSCTRDFLKSTDEIGSGVGAANFSGLGEMTGFSDFEEGALCSSLGEAVNSSALGGGNDMAFFDSEGKTTGFLSGSDAALTSLSLGSSGAVATEVGAFLLGPRARFFVMCVS